MTQPTPDSEDPGNTPIEDLLAALSPDDDVFSLVYVDGPTTAAAEPTDGD